MRRSLHDERQAEVLCRRRSVPTAGRLMSVLCMAVVAVVCMPPTAVMADQPAADQDRLKANVRDVTDLLQRLTVQTSKSIVVETTVPMTRVQSVNPGIAEVQSISPRQALITGVSFGTTQILVWSSDGQQQIFEVLVKINTDQLEEAIKRTDPASHVDVSTVGDTLMLTGTASDGAYIARIDEIARLFSQKVSNQLTVGGNNQVLVRVVIAEVSKQAIRQLGINGFMAGDDFADMFIINQLDSINPINFGVAGSVNVAGTIPFVSPKDGVPNTLFPTLTLGFPRVQMQLFLKAMRSNNLMRILAEPNLTAVSGEEANFLVGGEFPVPVPQDQDTITIEWREFGIRLAFIPEVLDGQRIRMLIAPEVSDIDYTTSVQFGGFTIPGLSQRRFQTTVEVDSGTTLAIAGLLNERVRGVAHKIPGLGDIPVLGALFSSVEYHKATTELVVLVTPEIIGTRQMEEVPEDLPGWQMSDPDDLEFFLFGLLEGKEARKKSKTTTKVVTATGLTRTIQDSHSLLSLHGPCGLADGDEYQ